MGRICQFLTCLVERLANTELPPAVRDEEGRAVATTALEIQLLQEALAPDGLTALLAAVGLRQLRTESDLDHLAALLQGYFQL
jgi:hypothetical protein